MVFVNTRQQLERRWAARRDSVLFLALLGASSYWGAREMGYRTPAEREASAAGVEVSEPTSGTPDHIEVTPERVAKGEQLYAKSCVACHAEQGAGKVGQGPRLASQSYLAAASDAMLFDTIAKGRTGTLMVAWEAAMSREDVMSLVAYIRSLEEHEPATLDESKSSGDPGEGAAVYKSTCAECHGPTGKGYNESGKGTAILNPAFLDTASDGFLRQMIRLGKSGTEMKGFDATAPQLDKELSSEQIENVIAYMRSGGG